MRSQQLKKKKYFKLLNPLDKGRILNHKVIESFRLEKTV